MDTIFIYGIVFLFLIILDLLFETFPLICKTLKSKLTMNIKRAIKQ